MTTRRKRKWRRRTRKRRRTRTRTRMRTRTRSSSNSSMQGRGGGGGGGGGGEVSPCFHRGVICSLPLELHKLVLPLPAKLRAFLPDASGKGEDSRRSRAEERGGLVAGARA
eukprot:767170-Hanusia_phi.AAC.1